MARPVVLPRYVTGVWSEEEPHSWSFVDVYAGNSLPAARRALVRLRAQLPPNAAEWAFYIRDQRTGEHLS